MASAALLHRYRDVAALRYWKPIQTGIEADDDTSSVRWLGGVAPERLLTRGVRLARPLSPHLAARLAGAAIDLAHVAAEVEREPASDRWVVEGAGGVLVPINARELMVDLMARLGLPALVVARTQLGTINHTLLTLEALRARSLRVAGVLLVGEPALGTREAIEAYGRVPVVGEMPPLAPLDPATLGAWATGGCDPDGHLAGCFR